MTDGLPTPRTTLSAGYGDVPLIHLHYRCSNCGSRHTDWIVTSRYSGRPAWARTLD
jgi:hypothetical protein